MRIYGSVQICFWANPKIQKISDQGKLLAIYLLTGPHSNMIGCYRLPDGYITEDLCWDTSDVKKSVQELNNVNFLIRDDSSNWLIIYDFLKWNPIQNPRQGIGVKKLFELVPVDSIVYEPLIKSLVTNGKYFDEGFVNRLHTLFKECYADTDNDQKQDQYQDKENKQNQDTSGKSVSFPKNIIPLNEACSYESNAQAILEFLNFKAEKSFESDDINLKWIIARLKDGADSDTCRQIIVRKCRQWLGHPKMDVYLRPSTLFNQENFLKYKDELVLPEECIYVDSKQCMP